MAPTKKSYKKKGRLVRPTVHAGTQTGRKRGVVNAKVKGSSFQGASTVSILSKKNNPDPFPPKWNVKLTYTDLFNLTNTLGGLSNIIEYNLNNITDPDQTFTGHQPLYRDQMAALYNKYIVTGVRCKFTYSNPSVDGSYVLVSMNQTTTAQGQTLPRLEEMPFVKVGYLNNTGSQVTVMNEFIPIHKVLGITKRQYMDQLAVYGSSTASGSPATLVHCQFGSGNVNTTAAASNIDVIVEFEFNVQFFDRIIPAQS